MLKAILRTFKYVRILEETSIGLEKENSGLLATTESMGRYIDALETLKSNNAERIQSLEKEVADLKRHLSGAPQ